MKMSNLIPTEQWIALEQELNERSGFNCCIIDEVGIRITAYRNWANPLCPKIRRDAKGLAEICAQVPSAIEALPLKRNEMRLTTCAAGLLVIAMPIFLGTDFVGYLGCCGLLPSGGRIDTLKVGLATGLSAQKIEQLSKGIERLNPKEIDAAGEYLKRRLEDILTRNKK
ncbi:PocR ligand-binding domain-containing protein [Desulfovibrio ferrophilus]|uniref:Conserved uncharacterized protein n=1 Tax=Desulfovibrio ferrophilus TaxID=241368 RepID=A0A2Z6AYY9_9BACT|nr:PocR ligand-binding domain-containing protein [Desulfovibrio ferrophilus]BBD08487.1 conserved uncharacterized protein [Desulfovibrio ferrophilus]